MTKTEMMMVLGPALAGGVGSLVNSRQQGQQNQMTMADRQMQALQQKAQMLQGLQQNRQQMAQSGLNAMPLGQEQAYASRAKAMQALLPALAQYQGARPTDPGIAGAIRGGGPNLVQALAGNQGFQNTFSDQMTSQAMADRRKAIAQVNPQYEFSSLGGFGMDPTYDQTVDDARGTALARLKGFEGQQQALADQQVQLAMQQGAQPQGQQKSGGVKGFLGGLLKTAAPFAAFIPGVGPLAAVGLGAAGGALGNKMQGGGFVSGAVQGGIGAGLGAAGKSLASGQGLNPFNNGAGRAMSNAMSPVSLPLGSGAGQTVASKAGAMTIPSSVGGPSWLSGAKSAGQSLMGNMATSQAGFEGNDPSIGFGNISTQMPQGPQQPKLPMFNKADPRGGPQGPPPQASGMNPQSGIPMRNAAPYSGPPVGQQQGQVNPQRNMNIGERSLWQDLTTPLLPDIGNMGGAMANMIDKPTNPMTPYPWINQVNAMGKGMLAGSVDGFMKNILMPMSSPLGLATSVAGPMGGAIRGANAARLATQVEPAAAEAMMAMGRMGTQMPGQAQALNQAAQGLFKQIPGKVTQKLTPQELQTILAAARTPRR